jgi:hypothetical protein
MNQWVQVLIGTTHIGCVIIKQYILEHFLTQIVKVCEQKGAINT